MERRKVAVLHNCLGLAVQRTSDQVIFANAGGKTFRLSRPAVLATIGPAKQQATTVRFEELGSNVLMFVGDDHESVATAFLDGDDVLLVDSLGSMDDARWLRRVLCEIGGASGWDRVWQYGSISVVAVSLQ